MKFRDLTRTQKIGIKGSYQKESSAKRRVTMLNKDGGDHFYAAFDDDEGWFSVFCTCERRNVTRQTILGK